MGAAVARQLTTKGHDVLYASSGRSADTQARAEWAGLTDASTPAALARHSDIVLSICPPHAAADVARAVEGFRGIYVDANAVAPATVREIASLIEAGGGRMVDGGIIGGPPERRGTTRMYVSGKNAAAVTAVFEETALDVRTVADEVGVASALKMCYAAWTKGTSALLLGIRAVARREGVEEALLAEWQESQAGLVDRSGAAARAAHDKGWRWHGEMEEIAATFATAGLPPGFHQAAAEIYARSPRPTSASSSDRPDAPLDQVLGALLMPPAPSVRPGEGPEGHGS